MLNRIFAIDNHNNTGFEQAERLAKQLIDYKCADQIYIFVDSVENAPSIAGVEYVAFGHDSNRAKCKNEINEFFKRLGFNGFLHVVESHIQLLKDPSTYLVEQEHCMDVLDYDVYFSTTSDGCNYVYSKFNPRVTIQLDSPEFKSLNLPQSISFTSHSNTVWVTYNFAKIVDELLKFDERFNIPMYFIIEFLARRRNTKSAGSLYLMNQYLSIPSEIGVFTQDQESHQRDQSDDMQKEDAIFKSLDLNFVPDNNIDQLLVDMIDKLKSKV